MPPLVGFEDEYEKLRTLGRSDDGITHLVKKRQGGQEYVAKESHTFMSGSWKRYKEDILKLRQFQHQHVLKVYDVLEDYYVHASGQLRAQNYVITDYAHGGNLYDYVRKVVENGSLSEEWLAHVFKQTMSGISYLHGNGIAHRDVKPSNILMMGAFSTTNPMEVPLVVLGDCGRSTLARNPRFSLGDPRYKSPETWQVLQAVWGGERQSDFDQPMHFKSDIWSLGVTLFEVLSGGRLPFLYCMCDLHDFMKSETFMAMLRDALFDEKPVRVRPYCAGASSMAESLLLKLMEKDARKRPRALDAMSHPWFSVKAGPVDEIVSRGLRFNATKGEANTMLLNALAQQLTNEHHKDYAEVLDATSGNQSGMLNLQEYWMAWSKRQSAGQGGFSSDEHPFSSFESKPLSTDALYEHLRRLFKTTDTESKSIGGHDLGHAPHGAIGEGQLADIAGLLTASGNEAVSMQELHSFMLDPSTAKEPEQRTKQTMGRVSRSRSLARLGICLEGLLGCH